MYRAYTKEWCDIISEFTETAPFFCVCPVFFSQTARTILYTDQEMIPVKNAIDAHAQDFVTNDELLLPVLKALHSALARYSKCSMFLVCVVVEDSVAFRNSSPAVTRTAPDTPTPPRGSSSCVACRRSSKSLCRQVSYQKLLKSCRLCYFMLGA
jgi:hypothetical protein